ncbi:MAG: EAL domain-containing protein [Pseudomonadota bacterium]|nr:EAL domain-containing protein [Pseudomonadota bacterium]
MIDILLASVALAAAFALGVVLTWRWRRAARGGAAHHAAFLQSPHGMLLVDAQTLCITDANPALVRSVGIPFAELRGSRISDIFGASDGTECDALTAQLRESPARLLVETVQRCRSGRRLYVEISGHRLEIAHRSFFALSTRDVTLRRKVQAQQLERQQYLDHLAHHDQLTGLPNRLYLAAHLPKAIEEARRVGGTLAVLFLDLDRFKDINDSRGHDTGDKLLQEVARRIAAAVHARDMVVRMGGDEFIVVLRSVTSPEQITETAARLADVLNAPVVIDGRPLVATASIGVSVYPRDGQSMGELLRQSDTAMYQAKDHGRNTFQQFSRGMERRLKERVAIENGLRRALAEQHLELHYQPIVAIGTRKVVALEALLRWRGPHGFIRPSRFIGVAEQTGLIVPVGEFVVQQALADLGRWRAQGATLVPVALNVSAVQLQRGNFTGMLARQLRRADIGAELVQIELTESALFEPHGRRADPAQDAIVQLRELGTRIVIDDFGTGYSSLSYLKRWRVDALKIDRSFIRDLTLDAGDLAIVEAIIAMARHLNIELIAEGVESWPQLERLRELGCDRAQGFLLARPVPAGQCRRFLDGAPLELHADEEPFPELRDGTGGG